MWIARLSGMRVDKFSIFFGPVIMRWRGKDTSYQLATIPLGGYVQIAGMNPQEQLPPDDPGSYQNKSGISRLATVFAGPAINYLFAMILVFLVMLIWGEPIRQIGIGSVQKNMPAEKAGLKPYDILLAIDNKPIARSTDVAEAIKKSDGKAMQWKVRREAKVLSLSVIPKKEKEGWKVGIGYALGASFKPIGIGKGFINSIAYPFRESARQLKGLGHVLKCKMTKGCKTSAQMGGPIEIIRQLKMSFEQGFAMSILFIAMLSTLLGLFNLLPLPALDGGRMVFILIEMVIRRRINQRVENYVHTAGFFLLIGLVLYFSVGDVKRLLG